MGVTEQDKDIDGNNSEEDNENYYRQTSLDDEQLQMQDLAGGYEQEFVNRYQYRVEESKYTEASANEYMHVDPSRFNSENINESPMKDGGHYKKVIQREKLRMDGNPIEYDVLEENSDVPKIKIN